MIPLIKITFANPSFRFDFAEPRREFAKGAIREFMPAGETILFNKNSIVAGPDNHLLAVISQ
jgi:methyl coenzyme M reductase alpha subunit